MVLILDNLATITCFHGGQVKAVTTNTKVKAEGAKFLLRIADIFTVVGCSFTITTPTGPIYSPCITVQWSNPALKVKVMGIPVLLKTSIGLGLNALGIPQGPVTIITTQNSAKAL